PCEPMFARCHHGPPQRMPVGPPGRQLAGCDPRAPGRSDTLRVGYFAGISPEKGLRLLAQACVEFRRRTAGAKARLEAAGYLSRAQLPYLDSVKCLLEKAGLAGEFTYRGALDRDGKLAFLRWLDVLSVPAPY